MRRALGLTVAAALLLAGCVDNQDPRTPNDHGERAAACPPALERGLRSWAGAGFSGSIAVVRDDTLTCAVAYGAADRSTGRPNTPGTVFSLGSITKAFTAAAVLGLAEQGELELSDRAGELLPSLRGPAAGATVRQLVLHTSGIVGSHGGDHEPLGDDAAIAAIGGLEQAFAPGTRYAYSNAGYTLLALIVEEVSGMPYREYVASHLLRLPDGEVAGGFWDGGPRAEGPRAIGYMEGGAPGERGDFPGPHWAIDGNGGLAMTMPRLAEWTEDLFTGRVVSPAVARKAAEAAVKRGKGRWATAAGWVRIGAAEFGEPVIATSGGGGDVGQNAVVAWLPESRTTIAMASNTPRLSAEQLIRAIGPAIAAGRPVPHAAGPATTTEDVDTYRGTYRLPAGGRFEVVARDGALEVSASGPAAIAALFPTHPDHTAAQVTAHEDAVRALLRGENQDGRKERTALESAMGPIEQVDVEGSIVADGELRTYVLVRSATRSLRLWYALTAEGTVAAAEGPAEPAALRLRGDGPGRFRPDDPTGTVTEPVIGFGDDGMSISGAASGTVTARRTV